MRVLQINALYRDLSTGRLVKELHEAMEKSGMESYVAAPDLRGLQDHGYQIGTVFDQKIHAALSRVTGLQGYYSRLATGRLLRYMDAIKPDVVHLHNLHSNYINLPMLLKYLADHETATVLTLHDCWFYTGKCVHYTEDGCTKWKRACGSCPALHKGNNSFFFDRSRKMLGDKGALYSKINKLGVIGVSAWTAEDAGQSVLKDAKIIRKIYNWIDLDIFCPQDKEKCREKWGFGGKRVILGVAAVWNEQKGIGVFQELARMIPGDMVILLAGRPPKQHEDDGRLYYAGEIHDVHQLAELYGLADVFVNPTVQETFGKTTAEAMACGVPVAACRTTAMPELLGEDESCGLLVEERTAEAFLPRIFALLAKNQEVLSRNCRRRAEQLFDRDKNINQYFEVYRALWG